MKKYVAHHLLERSEAIYPEEKYVYLASDVEELRRAVEQLLTAAKFDPYMTADVMNAIDDLRDVYPQPKMPA